MLSACLSNSSVSCSIIACWSGVMFTALFVGRKLPVIVESTVSCATLLVKTPALLLTITENCAPLSEPCVKSMVKLALVLLAIGLPFRSH